MFPMCKSLREHALRIEDELEDSSILLIGVTFLAIPIKFNHIANKYQMINE